MDLRLELDGIKGMDMVPFRITIRIKNSVGG